MNKHFQAKRREIANFHSMRIVALSSVIRSVELCAGRRQSSACESIPVRHAAVLPADCSETQAAASLTHR